MTRAFIATAAALVAASTFMSSAAQACISCEYVPEVVRNHATSPLAYGRGDNSPSHHGASVGYSVRKRFATSNDAPKSKKTAKIERSEKVAKVSKPDKSEPEKVAKISKPEKSEPVKIAKTEPVEKKAETKAADSESSSITVASVAEAKPAATETKAKTTEAASKATDCKKFFASVGMTLTVPCE